MAMADIYIQKLLTEGYPKEIIGNGGYRATLCGIQMLDPNDHLGIYRYPGGECCHSLDEAIRFSEKHNEVCIQIINPREVDGHNISYVSLQFKDKVDSSTRDRYDCMIDINLYDDNKNSVLFEEYETHSFTNIWTIEKTIDSALLFAIGDSGIAYDIVSYDINEFEQECEVER